MINTTVFSVLIIMIAVFIPTIIILWKKNEAVESKYAILKVIIDPKTTLWTLSDQMAKTSFKIIYNDYIAGRIKAYLQTIMEEASANTIGGYIYWLEKTAGLSQEKKSWLIFELSAEALNTDPELLAKAVVDSLYKEFVNQVGNDSASMRATRDFIIPLILSQGNASGLASLFSEAFDKGISSLLKSEETKPKERVLIEAESIKFHKLLGH